MPTYHSQTSQPALNLTLTGMGIIGTGSGMDGLTAQTPRPAAVAAARAFVAHHRAHGRAFAALAGAHAVPAAPTATLAALQSTALLVSEHDGLALLANPSSPRHRTHVATSHIIVAVVYGLLAPHQLLKAMSTPLARPH